MNLIYKNEKTLFAILLVISSIIWLAIILGTLGLALVYVFVFFIFYLFAQSAFISYLKGTAVKITPTQFPDLSERVNACAAKLELREVPDAYILNGNGVFNAFATRFLGRNFIVLLSDIVDALEQHPDAINFYIGHEIGHIKRNHIGWSPVLMPASFLPLVGAAYSRACEYTCDRHGLAACVDMGSAQLGLAALAAGAKRWRTMSKTGYAEQSRDTSAFWMSFHEYLSDYPWLTKRMAALKALASGQEATQPSRNPIACFLAIFVPRLGLIGGGAGSLIVVVAIIGILAAVAIPQYQDYVNKAQLMQAVSVGRQATVAVDQYYSQKNAVPENLEQAGFSASTTGTFAQVITVNPDNGIISVALTTPALYAGKQIIFVPNIDANKQIVWQCSAAGIPNKVLPQDCQSN